MNHKIASALAFGAVVVAAAAAATLVSRNAHAESITDYVDPFVSTTTREQVRSDLKAHPDLVRRAASEWLLQDNQNLQFRSTFSTDEVRSAYKASRAEVRALTGEDSGSFYFRTMSSRDPAASMGGPAR